MYSRFFACALLVASSAAVSQLSSPSDPSALRLDPPKGAVPLPVAPVAPAPLSQPMTRILPASTLLTVASLTDISSKTSDVGDQLPFAVVGDIVENGSVAIPRGTPVKAVMSWKTRRGIGGKSGKFELEFKSIMLNGHEYALRGKHRQEGKGNTVGALLGSIWISGHSAVMTTGQTVNAFTAEPIGY